jgi:glycosyltransferase involved in cell wall biosynthesis
MGVMKIAWLSARVLANDLCDTTQIALAEGLVNHNFDLTFYSPGSLTNSKFKHVELSQSKIPGLKSRFVSKQLKSMLQEINGYDHILIDWRLNSMIRHLKKDWTLIDRGPPGDRNILSLFQKIQWKKAWKKAERGCVVSDAHSSYVRKLTKNPSVQISVLPAGVDTERFFPKSKNVSLSLTYQGTIDKHRGITGLLKIVNELDKKGVTVTLYLHGKGNMVEKIRNLGKENVVVTGVLGQKELSNRLGTYDVGFLPMPATAIWRLASPLKRGEYFASGLVVVGIDHTGHKLGADYEWMQLYQENEFVSKTVEWLTEIQTTKLRALQKEARAYAEDFCSWESSVTELVRIIES